MALLTDNEVQLRISARAEGGAGVDALAVSVDDLQKELDAVAVSAKNSGTAQAEAANKLAAAKTKMDDVKLSLMSAKNEYKFLADRAKEAGAGQSIFAEQAANAKNRVASLNTELIVSRGNVRLAGDEHRNAAIQTKTHAAEQQRLAEQLRLVEAESRRAGLATNGLADAAKTAAKSLVGIEMGRQFIEANVGLESLERALTQILGSSGKAAAEIEWLRNTTNRLGIDTLSAAKAYTSLAASAKGTSLEGEGTRRIFEAVAGSMAKLGKSSADTEGALQAVSQMMGKGVVSMEEMRQQLAERLPGAMQATADALGITVGELTEMIGTGSVLAEDLLPAMARGLEKMYGTSGQAEGMVSNWNRMKNAISETFVYLGDLGIITAMTTALGWLAAGVRGLTGAFQLLGSIIGITFGAIATFDWRNPIASIKAWKTAVTEAGDDIQKKMDAASAALEETTKKQEEASKASKDSAQAAAQNEVVWLTVVGAYKKVTAAAQTATEQAVKSAAARQEEGKATLSLANLLGTETDKRTAGLAVATQSAESLQTLANARQHEASVAAGQAESLAAVAQAEGGVSEEKRKAIQVATDKATALQSEADKSAAAALGANQHAAALQTESAALADNSGRILELKSAAEQAAASVELLKAARAAGTATAAQVSDAEIKSAQAAALYRDALNDQTSAIQRNATEKQSKLSLDQAGVRLDIERQRTIYEVAKAQGNEYGATQALLEIKRLEIKLAELTAQAKRAEADAALLVAQAKREELKASGQLTAAKEAELKAQEAGARVKQIEAQIAGETATRMRQLADSYRLTGDAAQSASGGISAVGNAAAGSVAGVDALTSSLNKLSAAQKGADGINRNSAGQHVDNNGNVITDKNGNPVTNSTSLLDQGHSTDKQVDIESLMYKRNPTATVNEVKAAAKYYSELYARGAATQLTGNLGNADNAARLTNQVANQAMDKALELARRELATGQAIDLGTSVSDLAKRNIETTNWQNQVTTSGGEAAIRNAYKNAGNAANEQTNKALTTVNINLNGQRNQLTMDEQSASSLAGIFKKLESDAARSF